MIERMDGARDAVLSTITESIVDALRPARVILFGSRARGDARADSDYDVVVELTYDTADAAAIRSRARQAIANSVQGICG